MTSKNRHLTGGFKDDDEYLRNFLTDRPFMQPQYRDGRDYVEVPRELYKAGKLNAVQSFMVAVHGLWP
jgi:hypothetical protein